MKIDIPSKLCLYFSIVYQRRYVRFFFFHVATCTAAAVYPNIEPEPQV